MANLVAKKDQETRRNMLLKQLEYLRYLLRQGLAIRGHNDNEEGNLDQLLKGRANNIPQLANWLHTKKYRSQMELMATQLLRSLLDDIKAQAAQPLLALIVDETRDICGVEQLAICIRWVNQSYELRCNLPLAGCYGQAYDGAANMAGHLNGVAAQVQQTEPKAIFIHCLVHSLNLCLQECAKQSKPIRDALALVNELHNLIKLSPKRLALIKQIQSDIDISAHLPSIKPLCPTRWTVRTAANDSVLKNYCGLLEVLEKISEGASGEASSKAAGLATSLEQFHTYSGLKCVHLVFSATEQLATTLQGKTVTAEICIQSRDTVMTFLQRQRCSTVFDSFYDLTIEESCDITDELKLPRCKRIPRQRDGGAENFQHETPRDYFRQQYFEVLDILLFQIQKQLNQKGLSILN